MREGKANGRKEKGREGERKEIEDEMKGGRGEREDKKA